MASFKNLISNTSAQIASGGTITGDLVINGDLQVDGGGSLSFDEIIEGTSVIDVTDTEAFLVRKNGDAGDVFIVDTTNRKVGLNIAPNANLDIRGDDLFIGNADTDASSRIMFVEKASDRTQGFSLLYAGSANPTLGGQAFTASANTFNIFRHNGTAGGENVLSINRTSGNVGIGATPQSGWQSSYTALQLSNSVLYNNGGNDLFLGANFYFDGSNNKYITANGRASAIGLADGALKFFVSSSTTHSADDNVSFNQALTIANDGDATFGGDVTIDSGTRLTSEGTNQRLKIHGSGDNYILTGCYEDNGWGYFNSYNNANGIQFYTGAGSFYFNNANVGIGVASADNPLSVYSAVDNVAKFESSDAIARIVIEDNASENNGNWIAVQNDVMSFATNGSNTALTLDSSQNATFAGDVTISGGDMTLTGATTSIIGEQSAGATRAKILFRTFGSDGDITFETTTNGAGAITEQMRITHEGNVGINTTSPNTLLEVSGTSAIRSTYTGTSSAGVGGALQLVQDDGSAIESGHRIGYVVFGASEDSSNTIHNGGAINAFATETYSASGNGTKLTFDVTANGGTSRSTALTLDQDKDATFSGSITASENTDTTNVFGRVALHSVSSDYATFSHYDQRSSGANYALRQTSTGATAVNSASGQRVNFNINNLTKMIVSADGNVGIGTTSPMGNSDGIVGLEISNGASTGLTLKSTSSSQIYSLWADASGNLKIQDNTNNVTPLTIDSSQNVGIGVSPSAKLDINISSNARGYFSSSIGEVGSGNFALQVVDSSGATLKPLGFRAEDIRFATGSSERMRLDDNSRISLSNNDSGTANTVFGRTAGDAIASGGNNNTLFGFNAGSSITTGDGNTLLGYRAGETFDTNSNNVGIGSQALGGNGNASNCIAIGATTLSGSLSSSSDGAVAIGHNALSALTSGAGLVVIGYNAGDAITSGDYNTAIGYGALGLETTGDRNTAVGFNSLANVNGVDHASNTAVGFESGYIISSGQHNVTIGAKAGNVITTGDYNVIIGGESDPSGNNGQNQTVVGYGATGLADNTVTLGNSSVTDVYMAQDGGATVHCANINFYGGGASSGGVNNLDDYEEGDHTVTVTDNSGTITLQSGGDTLSYTKIGRQVTVAGELQLNDLSGAGSGALRFTLPFAVADQTEGADRFAGSVYTRNVDYSSNVVGACVKAVVGGSVFNIVEITDDGSEAGLAAGSFATSDEVTITLTYFTS